MSNITLIPGEIPVFLVETGTDSYREPWWQRAFMRIAEARRHAAAEREVRKKVQQLRDLDDWILADMGLTRSALEHAVRHGHPRDL
jgi:uncharacterized protein YjiS (DUF1127 family)